VHLSGFGRLSSASRPRHGPIAHKMPAARRLTRNPQFEPYRPRKSAAVSSGAPQASHE